MKIITRNYLAKYIALSVVLLAFSTLLYGCATTPNISIVDENFRFKGQTDKNLTAAKSILTEISLKNELLAIELGKLPELQNGISLKERLAVETVSTFYNDNQSVVDRDLVEMLKIGIPETRKYCSLLQALFWLAEDGQLNTGNNPLVNYSLTELLDRAWNFNPIISEDKIREIIRGIKIEDKKKLFFQYLDSGNISQLKTSILQAYRLNPRSYSREARKAIKESIERNPRWGDFNAVVDRLNAPELVNYYQRARFSYEFGRRDEKNFYYLFKTNKGNCSDFTAFTIYCLQKAGYRAWEDHVASPSGLHPYHIVCAFESNGKKYIMDNGRPDKLARRGIIPYKEYDPFEDEFE